MVSISIAGIKVPGNKPIRIALGYIYGINKKYRPKSVSNIVLRKAGIDPSIKAEDLNDEQMTLISQEIHKLLTNEKIEEGLKKKTRENIEKIIDINCWRGKRHSMGKKVNGQSSRRNNRNRPNVIYFSEWPFCITKKRETVANKKKAPKQG